MMNELATRIGSYPYLTLTRKYKEIGTTVTYSEILCFADAYKKHFHDLNYWEYKATGRLQNSPLAKEIIAIHKAMDEYVAHNK